MNKQLSEIKDQMLIAEGLMIAAAANFDKDKPAAIRQIVQVEAKLNQLKSQVTQFLETDHFANN